VISRLVWCLSALGLSACLVDWETYEARYPLVADADGDGTTIEGGDCDDHDPDRHPAAPEHCNEIDDNCDGIVDNELTQYTWYPDADGDGWGAEVDAEISCKIPDDGSAESGDCDDADATISPDAVDILDGLDNNCDGSIDFASLDDLGSFTSATVARAGAGRVLHAVPWPDTDGLAMLVGAPGDASFVDDAPTAYLGVPMQPESDFDAAARVTDDHSSSLGHSLTSVSTGLPTTRVVVGAPDAAWSGATSGGVVLFWADELEGGSVLAPADGQILEAEGIGNHALGYALGSAGDWDGDGVEDLLIGDSGVPSGDLSGAGAIYVVSGDVDAGVAVDHALWFAYGAHLQGHLGGDLAGGQDLDGDGYPELVGSAFNATVAASSEGAAFIWLGGAAGAQEASDAVGVVSGGVDNASLGRHTAMWPDADGDSRPEVVLGARAGENEDVTARLAVFQGHMEGTLSIADASLVIEAVDANYDLNMGFSRQIDHRGVALHYAGGSPAPGSGVKIMDLLGETQFTSEPEASFLYSPKDDESGVASLWLDGVLWLGAPGAGDAGQGGLWRVETHWPG